MSVRIAGLWLVAAALAGCSSGGYETAGVDLGRASSDLAPAADAAFAAPDMGFASDASFPSGRFDIELRAPEPLSSGVATSAALEFCVLLRGASISEVEVGLQVLKRGSSSPLAGGYVWNATSASCPASSLRFIPSAPLTDSTDWVVHVHDSFGRAVLSTGFSTGSHPRVISAELLPDSLKVRFSEDMAVLTVQTSLSVQLAGQMASGTVALDSSGQPDLGTQSTREFVFTFSSAPSGTPGDLKLRVATTATSALPPQNLTLDPVSWDTTPSTRAADGAFLYDFGSVVFLPSTDVAWTATVH